MSVLMATPVRPRDELWNQIESRQTQCHLPGAMEAIMEFRYQLQHGAVPRKRPTALSPPRHAWTNDRSDSVTERDAM